MDRCHFFGLLSSYIDGELKYKQKLELEEHIKVCDACRKEVAALKALSAGLKKWQVPELDRSFDRTVQDEIVRQELEKGEAKMKKRTWMVLAPSGALAAVLLVMFVVAGGLRSSGIRGISEKRYLADREKAAELSKVPESKVQYEPYYMTRTGTQSIDGFASTMSGAGSVDRYETARSVVYNQLAYDKTVSQLPLDQDGPVVIVEPTLPATADSEKIIRTGTVLLEVEDGEKAYQKALVIAQELGGYIANSNFYKDRDNRQSGTITIRVPKDKFASALDRFGSLGKVENVSTDSRDVTQEYANLQSQLDVAMVAYKKMLEALQKKQVTIPEAMRIESELTPVLHRVQQLKNQIEALNNVISYPTITLNFHEATVSVKYLKESTRYIKESLINAGITAVRIAAAVIPIAVVVLIVGGILFAVVFWIIRVSKRG